jgi:CheY-like chemotaxis protein
MRTLLLADDSITVQRVIALTFAEEPVNVVTVSDGRQAMELLAAQKPDIVLAGTNLPHVSGYELARFIRSKPDLKGIPILLLSGAFETVDNARLMSSGANGVLEKPVEPTVVIGRVKELLGLKSDPKPATAGRLVTSAGGPSERKVPGTPPSVTSTRPAPSSQWDQLRDRTGLDANTRSVEDPSMRADDYLDTLDEAFDSLDRQISGRPPKKSPPQQQPQQQQQQRNPSGPLGQGGGAADPRSPGRSPAAGQPGNPVFEVDDEWFGAGETAARADARAGRREIADDLRDPELQLPKAAPAAPIYEVDDEWFVEDEKARALRGDEKRQLAAEMGLHDLDLPSATDGLGPSGPASDLNFSLDDLKHLQTTAPAPEPGLPPPVLEMPKPQAIAAEPVMPVMPVSPIVPMAPIASVVPAAPSADAALSPIADDFAALLAYEQGEQPHPPTAASAAPEVKVVAPEVTDDMLDQIAARVADRLSASAFGDWLKDAMASTMRETVRETVRTVVAETSERLVRDEIERIKSKSKT